MSFLSDVFNDSGHLIHTYYPLPRRKEEMDVEVDDTVFDLSFPDINIQYHYDRFYLKIFYKNKIWI